MKLIHKYFPGLSEAQMQQFETLLQLYPEWNNRINIISRKDIDMLEERHILHSLAIAKFIQFTPGTEIMDIGCGGGFPVIPLAVLFPEVKFTAVDSIGKKILVVKEVANAAGLKNVIALNARAETVNAKFDFILSRAVAPLQEILTWSKGKLKNDNRNEIANGFIFLKGGDLTEEYKDIQGKFFSMEKELKEYFPLPFFETKKLVYLHLENPE
jgi:16S rRNA (guanine527-N7)-methyltransferase